MVKILKEYGDIRKLILETENSIHLRKFVRMFGRSVDP
jgi:hypothetical protein